MSAWYPQCGEPYELESACVGGLLGEIDKRCQVRAEAEGHACQTQLLGKQAHVNQIGLTPVEIGSTAVDVGCAQANVDQVWGRLGPSRPNI